METMETLNRLAACCRCASGDVGFSATGQCDFCEGQVASKVAAPRECQEPSLLQSGRTACAQKCGKQFRRCGAKEQRKLFASLKSGVVVVYDTSILPMQRVASIPDSGITNPNPITAMDYDAGTGTLFTGSKDGIILWTVKMGDMGGWGRRVAQIASMEAPTSLAWAQSSREIIAGFDNGAVVVFDMDRNQGEPSYAIQAHADGVTAVKWLDAPRRLLTASKDKTLKIWDFPSMQRCIQWRFLLVRAMRHSAGQRRMPIVRTNFGGGKRDDFMAGCKGKECSLDKQFKLELCQQLSAWLGWAACAFASWEVICRSIASKQKDLVRHLNETMFDADCQVARLQPICINGCLGQLPEDAGDILSVGYLQRNGKKQMAKALDPRRQRLAEFKLQGRTVKEQLDKFVADAHDRGDVYIIVLDQRFFCQQDDSQTGPLQWRRSGGCGNARKPDGIHSSGPQDEICLMSKTILLRLEMQMQTRMAVQLDFLPSAEEDLCVRGINLAGEEDAFGLLRATWIHLALDPATVRYGDDTSIGLQWTQHSDKLCMVLPDGTYASADMDSKTIIEVFT
eukprot:s3624_g5.t1